MFMLHSSIAHLIVVHLQHSSHIQLTEAQQCASAERSDSSSSSLSCLLFGGDILLLPDVAATSVLPPL
jgi:hypothetical protein